MAERPTKEEYGLGKAKEYGDLINANPALAAQIARDVLNYDGMGPEERQYWKELEKLAMEKASRIPKTSP